MKCNDSRKCFGQELLPNGEYGCKILTKTYLKDGECPFCKEFRSVTNGQVYPYIKPEDK